MHGEVVGLNTLKLIKKNTTGIALALSAGDLLEVLHRFCPVTAPAASPTAAPRNSVSKAEEMSARPERPPAKSTVAVATGTVSFLGTSGARIYVDGSLVGNVPSTIPLGRRLTQDSSKRRKMRRSAGKFAGARRGQPDLQGGISCGPIKHGGRVRSLSRHSYRESLSYRNSPGLPHRR
jgi:hypothetical protein